MQGEELSQEFQEGRALPLLPATFVVDLVIHRFCLEVLIAWRNWNDFILLIRSLSARRTFVGVQISKTNWCIVNNSGFEFREWIQKGYENYELVFSDFWRKGKGGGNGLRFAYKVS
jgi:hypothetical protein